MSGFSSECGHMESPACYLAKFTNSEFTSLGIKYYDLWEFLAREGASVGALCAYRRVVDSSYRALNA